MKRAPFFIPVFTLAQRETRRFLRIWLQSLLPPVMTAALYFLIFGQVIGSRMKLIDGLPYIDYIVPGLVLMPVFNAAFSNVSSSFFSSKLMRSIDLLLMSPMSNNAILLGFLIPCILRATLLATLVLGVALCFTHMKIDHLILLYTIIILSGALFGLLGLINGIFAKSFDGIAFIPTFVIMPLTYFSGVFYAISMLPHWAQILSHFNPIYYIVSAAKFAFLGIAGFHAIIGMITLVVITFLLYLLCLSLLTNSKGLRP
jgi:ABC-2 type transport system permease protein